MSKAENNRKIIETYYKSIASGDFETVISLMHEDVVFNIVGETPYAGKWEGRDNVYGILVPAVVSNFKEGDKAKILVCAHTHDTILCFSTQGKAFSIRVFDIPDTSRQARGKSINNILPLDNDETISALLSIKSFDEDSYLFLTTRDGMVNRLSLSSFKKVRNSGLKAILLKDDDYLFNALHTSGNDKIIL